MTRPTRQTHRKASLVTLTPAQLKKGVTVYGQGGGGGSGKASRRGEAPLFIPLKTCYFEQFANGTKTVEYRRYGRGWNHDTCRVGRPVVISKGYGKYSRLTGQIVTFHVSHNPQTIPGWSDCYGHDGNAQAACIGINLTPSKP